MFEIVSIIAFTTLILTVVLLVILVIVVESQSKRVNKYIVKLTFTTMFMLIAISLVIITFLCIIDVESVLKLNVLW